MCVKFIIIDGMRAFLILSLYLIIPLISCFLFRNVKNENLHFSFLISGILVLLYPFLLFYMETLIYAPTETHCGLMQTSFLIGNITFFLPISLLFQWLFNYLFIKRRKNKEEISKR